MLPENLYGLPLEQQIGQFLFIGLPGTELDADTRALIEEVKPGGIIIFGRNVAGPEQLRSLLDGVRELVPTPPLIGIDQEGGLVDRLDHDLADDLAGRHHTRPRRPLHRLSRR